MIPEHYKQALTYILYAVPIAIIMLTSAMSYSLYTRGEVAVRISSTVTNQSAPPMSKMGFYIGDYWVQVQSTGSTASPTTTATTTPNP